jgi:hypothetical protein
MVTSLFTQAFKVFLIELRTFFEGDVGITLVYTKTNTHELVLATASVEAIIYTLTPGRRKCCRRR